MKIMDKEVDQDDIIKIRYKGLYFVGFVSLKMDWMRKYVERADFVLTMGNSKGTTPSFMSFNSKKVQEIKVLTKG